MKITTITVLQFLKFLAYVAMIGYSIEAGSIIISAIVSVFNPVATKDLYKHLDLSQLRTYNINLYYLMISFIAGISILKAKVWLMVIKMLSNLNLRSPFRHETAWILKKISFTLLYIWVVSLTANILATILVEKLGQQVDYKFPVDEFLFMAGLVYVISQVFKRGIEIQSENELTV